MDLNVKYLNENFFSMEGYKYLIYIYLLIGCIREERN